MWVSHTPHLVLFHWCTPYARGTPDRAHHPQFPPCPLEEVRSWRRWQSQGQGVLVQGQGQDQGGPDQGQDVVVGVCGDRTGVG